MNRDELIAIAMECHGEYDKEMLYLKNKKAAAPVSGFSAVTMFDKDYPAKLLDLKYPPYVLFYKGDLGLLKKEAIAIVGSRLPCEYAIRATKALTERNRGKVIISGLAKGIDAIAHLNAEMTIGILGCGIDEIYPACNRELITKIGQKGLLLSEYPGHVKPLAFHFPFRNRIIAALADRVYIMQSTLRSGTMTTVNEALEIGKDIRVLPYDIFDENGLNNNHLIYEGAQPLLREEIAF